MKIKDFGEKIGGARKDVWRKEGLSIEDLAHLNDAEREAYTKKEYVWPIPSGKQQVAAGTDVFVAYWQRTIRNMTACYPRFYSCDTKLESIKAYISAVRDLKARVMSCKTQDDICQFEEMSYKNNYDYDHWRYIINVRKLRALRYAKGSLLQRMQNANFPDGKKKTVERKEKFVPPQLERIERTGRDYRHGCHIYPDRWQREFRFRGVEFGNWCSQKERQASLDMCFDALKDLAYTLQIEDTDITFDSELALAFGARGHSSASAHYEPMRRVINLTKMYGAGCTAHEWFHALDHRMTKWFGYGDSNLALASNLNNQSQLPKSFVRLVHAIQKDADGNYTDFYRGSKGFDRAFTRDHFGYWSCASEMLARAFACYIKDTLGEKSDYLFAHADCYEFEFDCQSICAIPQGEEREIFNELFDQFFFELKTLGFFHQRVEKEYPSSVNLKKKISVEDMNLIEDPYGQLLLAF